MNSSPSTPDLFCPTCGYDLRAAESDRCPECGWRIDRAATSRIPWTHRHSIGRIRAYWRTVYFATFQPRLLSEEIARPVDEPAARSFARVVMLTVTLPAAALVLYAMWDFGGANLFNPMRDDSVTHVVDTVSGAADILIPYAAGVTLWPVVPACIVLFGLLLPGAFRISFTGGTDTRRARAAALSYYAVAPLALLAPAALLFAASLPIQRIVEKGGINAAGLTLLMGVMVLTCWLIGIVTLVITAANVLRLAAAPTQAPALKVIWIAIAMPLSITICAIIALLIVPWIVGLLFLMIDSVI